MTGSVNADVLALLRRPPWDRSPVAKAAVNTDATSVREILPPKDASTLSADEMVVRIGMWAGSPLWVTVRETDLRSSAEDVRGRVFHWRLAISDVRALHTGDS